MLLFRVFLKLKLVHKAMRQAFLLQFLSNTNLKKECDKYTLPNPGYIWLS
jgi:hypothetical protein